MSSKPPSSSNIVVKLPPLVPEDYDDTNPIGIATANEKTLLIHRPGAKAFFRWYDLWVGAYWDKSARHLYICPVPMFGIRFTVPRLGPYFARFKPRTFSARTFVIAILVVLFCMLSAFAGGFYISETNHHDVRSATSAMHFDAPLPAVRTSATEITHVLPSASVDPSPESTPIIEGLKKRIPTPGSSASSTKAAPSKNPYDLPPGQSGIVDTRF